MNEAVSYHLMHAVTGVSPNFTFDYTKLRFSNGKQEAATGWDVSATGNKVKFSWEYMNQDDDSRIDGTDLVNVLIYNPAKDRFVSKRKAVARSVKSFDLSIPAEFSLDEVHCYLSFSSVKKKNQVSDTIYLGLLPLPVI